MRQRYVDDFGARVAQPIDALSPQRLDFPRHAVGAVFLRNANPQALDRTLARGFEIRHRDIGAGRVFRIVSRHRAQQDRRIAHRPGERARMIERGGERDDAPARATPVSRLHPDQPAKRRRLPDRSAGVRAGRSHRQPGRHRRGRSARRSARHQHGGLVLTPLPRVLHRPVMRGHVGRTHRELVHVGLAEEHRAVAQQVGGHGRFVRRNERHQDLAARRGAHAHGAEQVLDRQRNAQQRPRIPLRQRGIGGARLIHRLACPTDRYAFSRGFNASIACRCARVSSSAVNFFARRPSRASAIVSPVRSTEHYSTTLGTAKKSPFRSGALNSIARDSRRR